MYSSGHTAGRYSKFYRNFGSMFDNLLEMDDICFRTISVFVLRRN